MVYFLILLLFCLGYLAIILESVIKFNKTAVALFMAVGCWMIYFLYSGFSLHEEIGTLNHHVVAISQIVLFLLGSMTIVELIDAHRGFKIITDLIETTSQRKLLWIIALTTFFLSSVLDNLTTTIMMISLVRKLIPLPKERFLLNCMIVVAANAGGAWTPIGDVTTTMLWIEERISSLAIIKALFLPSLVSLLVTLGYFTWRLKGKIKGRGREAEREEPGARLILILGVLGLISVPILKALTGLPPFMGTLMALALLWLVTDGIHCRFVTRRHLRVPHILTKIDLSGVLFFLGILLCVSVLDSVQVLADLASWLNHHVGHLEGVATLIGMVSAIIDNVPLVAASMSMYPMSIFPSDHTLWHMIAYAAGTGGSILIIGSSSGVALMGLEKIDFLSYMKKMSLPILAGYLVGMGVYLVLR